MTKIYPNEDLEAYEHSILARSGSVKDRNAWFKENNINDFKQMIFSGQNPGRHYYIFRNGEDALKFKVVWG